MSEIEKISGTINKSHEETRTVSLTLKGLIAQKYRNFNKWLRVRSDTELNLVLDCSSTFYDFKNQERIKYTFYFGFEALDIARRLGEQ